MRSFLGVSALILLYITVAEVIVIFIYIDTRIKVLKIGDHEILPNTTAYSLRDITCLTRIQVLLEL